MRLLIKYPTRGRPEQFLKALDNIKQTIGTSSRNYHIIVSADEDDNSMKEAYVFNEIARHSNIDIYFSEPTSKVGAINRDMPTTDKFDWLLCMSDDMVYVEDNWYDKMLADIKSVWGDSLDFFAHYNDGFVGDKLPTMAIMGVDYYKRFWYIYEPSYKSVSVDAEQMFVAQMLGRHHYFPQVYFNHVHPANLPQMQIDQTYRGNDKWGEADTANYFERMERLFDVKDPVMIPEVLRKELKERGVVL